MCRRAILALPVVVLPRARRPRDLRAELALSEVEGMPVLLLKRLPLRLYRPVVDPHVIDQAGPEGARGHGLVGTDE